MFMNEELIELVGQLMEFGYGDSLRLESISHRLKDGELPYPSDQRYVDMLVSKYLYPHVEEGDNLKKSLGSLEEKIQNVKRRYIGDVEPSVNENISDLCPKCSSLVPRMFSFCPKCGAFHDEHNFVDTNKSQEKQEKPVHSKHSSQDELTKSCLACDSKIFKIHEFCPMCGAYQGKNNFKSAPKRQSKQKRYTGLAIVGIALIVLGAISFIILSGFPNLCNPFTWQSAQITSPQVQQACFTPQTWNSGIILALTGIILLVVRVAKRRHKIKP